MPIKHDHNLNPVTAVAYTAVGWLVAEGPCLKIYAIHEAQLIAQCQILHEQTIHGIAVTEDDDDLDSLRVVIWGGSSIVILYGYDINAILNGKLSDHSSWEFTASDWILSVALSANTQDFVLLTAHNALLKATFSQDLGKFSLHTLDSPAPSILYSAHTIWENSNSIIVAAGTVFGEIIVWRCNLGETPISTILYTFTGHEGSIFGVHISPCFHDSRRNMRRVLSSCSDDRTIRLWDLTPEPAKGDSRSELGVSEPPCQKPGFEDNDEVPRSTIEGNRCLAVAWGHASRIWRVRTHIFGRGDSNAEKVALLSFGEDTTCQLWSIDSETMMKPPKSAKSGSSHLRHCKTFAYHSGKHIWAADIVSLNNDHCLVATGGADGKLNSFEISSMQLETAEAQVNECSNSAQDAFKFQYGAWTLEEILGNLIPVDQNETSLQGLSHDLDTETNSGANRFRNLQETGLSKKALKDSLNRYSFVAEDKIILTTTSGRILLGTNQSQDQIDWQELQMPNESSDLRGYSVLASNPRLQLAVIASANGSIYKYRHGHSIRKMGSVDGKVAALFLTADPSDELSLHLLVTVLGKLEASLFSWYEDVDGSSETVQSSPVYLPPKSIVTSTGEIGSFIYLGFRNGAIGALDPNEPGVVTLTHRPPREEHADAVTSIIEIPSTERVSYLVATSRNGTYKILTADIDNSSKLDTVNITMIPVHHSATAFGSIEDAWFERSMLYFAGFRSKQFVVWNETQKSEIMTIECGGAHRSYAYSHFKTSGGGTFIYSKASKLYLHTQKMASHKTIKEGGHGREIKACAVSSGNEYLATGAEDTMIRIWQYDDENPTQALVKDKFKCISIIEKHTTGIQHLKWHSTTHLFSSGGTEEFHIWSIQEIPDFGLGVICEATLQDLSPEQDLRITSFDILELSTPEVAKTTFLISLANSDSTIKSYIYSKSRGFTCIAQARYSTNCLTQLRYLPSPTSSTENEIGLLTAGTDGYLTTWSLSISSPSLTKLTSSKIHQNAIKTLDLISLANNRYILVSGGDDNSIAFSYYTNMIDKPKITLIRNAHAAAITALSVVGEGSMFTVVSSSNDQRVKVWDVRVGDDGVVEVEGVGDEFTAVADVGDMAVLSDGGGEGKRKVVVVGNGMDVWCV